MASEALAIAVTGHNPGAATARIRHLRFHRELFAAAAVTVHSGVVGTGAYEGRVIHLLSSGDTLSATAMDLPEVRLERSAPLWDAADIEMAMPRSLDAEPQKLLPERVNGEPFAPVGIVRPAALDHTGAMLIHELAASCSSSSFSLLDRIGFTHEFVKQAGITRMTVEMKVTRHGAPSPGEAMQARSYVGDIRQKAFSLRHQLETSTGAAIASVDQFHVVTDLSTRRGVEIPEVLRHAMLAERLENVER